MIITPEFLHYLSIGIAISLGAIGTGIGQGLAAFSVLNSIIRQETCGEQLFRTMMFGLVFIESGVILALVVTLLTLFGGGLKITWAIALAEFGIALSIGVAAMAITFASGFAVKASCESISRMPFFSQKILTMMLLTQTIIEAPLIFAFVVALIIRTNLSESLTIYQGIRFLAAGICMAFSCIGPCIGQGIFANSSCKAIGLNKEAYGKIFTFSVINQVIIETPIIFSLLITFLIIYWPTSTTMPLSQSIVMIASAITLGLGCVGAGRSIGLVGSKSCTQIALDPKKYALLFRSTLLSQVFIESTVIYAMLISLFLLLRI